MLDCPGVTAKGITTVTFGAGFGTPPPAGNIPPPPPIEGVTVVVEAAMDLFDLDILMVVPLGVGVLCFCQ